MTVSLYSDGPVNGPDNNTNITQFGLYSEASPDFSASDINVTQYGWGVEDVKGITLIQDYIDKAQAIYQDVLNAKSLLQVLIQEASEVESFYQEIKKVQEDIHQKYPIIVDQYNQIVSLAREVNDSRDAASVSAKAASDKVVQAQGILTQMQGLNSSVQSALTNVNTRYNEIVVLRDEVKAMNTESKQLVEDLRKGQVYRGTWNPHSGAWPDPKGTYSAWDVVLNPKEASFDWNGIKWLPGDRLLYILSEARYEQVESGVGVLSVNSKSGYVTLVPNDLGAYTKAEVDAKITPKFNTAGGTLTGAVTGPSFVQSGAQGTAATSLTRKDYVDGLLATKVDKTVTVNGKPLSGSVSLTSDDVGARSVTWVPGWMDITGVPTTFPPSTHQHSWGDLTGVPVQATRWPTFDEITGKPAGYPVAGHTHPWGEITGKPDFATRWPTASEVKARPDTWNPSSLVLVNKANANVMTGVGYNAFSNTAAAINFPSGVIGSGYEIVNGQADGKTLDSSVFQLWSPNDSPDIFTRTGDGSATGWVFRSWDKMYTSNNKPSSTDVGAVAKAGDTMTGKLIVPSFTDKLTGIGEVALPYKTLALADWGGVVGQTTFAKPDSIGAPSGTSGGYWNVLGKRDGAGGYAGLYIPHTHADNQIFIGRNESGNNAPTWIKVYTDINKPTPAEIGAMDSTVDLNALGGLPKEGGALSTTTDINTLVAPARHNIQGSNPNWAFPGNGGILDVYVHGGTHVRQVAFNSGNSQIKTRSLSGASWSTWATVYTSADKPTPADLGALSTSGGIATGNITATDFLQSTAQTNNAAASTRKDYVDTQDNLRVLKTTTVNGKPLSGNITLTPADIGAQPEGGESNSAKFLTRIDTRADNKIPSSINPGFTQEFKLNTTDGFTQGGGTYHTILSMQQWGESSGGFAKQLAIGDNGKIGLRVGSADYNSWGPWSMLYSEAHKPTSTDVGAIPVNRANGTPVATYFTDAAISSVGTKITLPYAANAGKMLSFTVRVYQGYTAADIQVSGYLYSAIDNWHAPKAIMIAGSTPIRVKMGKDANGKAYVHIAGSDYRGIGIFNVVSGYSEADWNSGWVITKSDDAPNAVLDTTIYPPYSPNNKPTPAEISAMGVTPPAISIASATPSMELHKPGVIAAMYSIDANNRWALSQTGGNAFPNYTHSLVDITTGQNYFNAQRWTASQAHGYANQWGQWSPITVDFGAGAGSSDYYPVIKGRHVIGGQGYTTDVEFGMIRSGNTWGGAVIRVGSAESGTAGTMATYNFDIGGNFTASGAVSGGTLKSGGGGVYTTGQLAINNNNPTLWLQDTDNRSAAIHNNSNILYILRGQGNNAIAWDGGPNGRHPMNLNLETGDVVFSGNVVAYSDRRLKKDIKPLENALEKVMKLEGVSYKRIGEDTNRLECGFVAQDLQEVIPEVVIEQQDEDKTLTVDYAKMNAYLVEAIKEQQRLIEDLQIQVKELRGGE